MTFLVATIVIASRPPERRPTGTATARAKIQHRMKTRIFVHLYFCLPRERRITFQLIFCSEICPFSWINLIKLLCTMILAHYGGEGGFMTRAMCTLADGKLLFLARATVGTSLYVSLCPSVIQLVSQLVRFYFETAQASDLLVFFVKWRNVRTVLSCIEHCLP